MIARNFLIVSALTLIAACDPAEDVRVQELPPLARPSVETRLGLPELRGPWRFAGWELAEGDTLGLDAELPTYGILWLQTQKRDSLAGAYVTGEGRTPLAGEVRRDSTVSLVAFPSPQDGRFIVGRVANDTIWVEMTTLSETASWRGDARAAFVRSQTALSPFRRVRGMAPPPPPVDSASLAASDSLALPPTGTAVAPTGTVAPPAAPPAAAARTPLPGAQPAATQPRTAAPVPQPGVDGNAAAEAEEAAEEPEDVPEPAPVIERRQAPRVLGVPVDSVDRD